MPQDIAQVYQACDPNQPLQPGDPRYVTCADVRGPTDIIEQLRKEIRISDMPRHLLFAGYRGSGKSTEFLRLQHALADTPEDRFFVVYMMADDDMDVYDVDVSDLLLAIVRQVGHALRIHKQIELHSAWFNRYIADLERFLGSPVEIEDEVLRLDTRIAKFTATMKSSPSTREQVRRELTSNRSRLIETVNTLLDEAVTRLQANGYRDLVVIVDNLDRIALRDLPNSQYNTHEQLFIGQGPQLAQLRCHVVYTLPPSILFSPHAPTLMHIFDRHPYILPMIKMITRDGHPDAKGMSVMRDIVCKRLAAVNVTEEAVFDSSYTLDFLCAMSGGQIRSLFLLIRSACAIAGALPLTRHDAEQAVRDMSRIYDLILRPEFFEILRQIEQTHDLPGSEYDQMLLNHLMVLQYMDSAMWYAVNPVVRSLEKFAVKYA